MVFNFEIGKSSEAWDDNVRRYPYNGDECVRKINPSHFNVKDYQDAMGQPCFVYLNDRRNLFMAKVFKKFLEDKIHPSLICVHLYSEGLVSLKRYTDGLVIMDALNIFNEQPQEEEDDIRSEF